MVKQYQKLIALEGAELSLTKDALKHSPNWRLKRDRSKGPSINFENVLDIMYELPSNKDIKKITINQAVVGGKKGPVVRKKTKKDAA